MTFISYAQNFEDVMLWRALKHIEKGFYIDVGAAWPQEHSVTKAFYDLHWRGINIEPNPIFKSQYELERSEDVNIFEALGEREGEAEMYFVSDSGLSSLHKDITEKYLNNLNRTVTQNRVKINTLANLCEKYAANKDIHFLKVDVEGFELQVLKGNDWQKYRPWIVVVESTVPLSQIENFDQWEPLLLEANYLFAYADGLNRFYIATERREILNSFKYPPNVFDEFCSFAQYNSEMRAQNAEARAQNAELKLQGYEQLLKAREEELKMHNEKLNILLTSHSWRLTAPLRYFNNWLNKRSFK